MKIGQKVHLVSISNHIGEGRISFGLTSSNVISFDSETVILGSFGYHPHLYPIAKKNVFDDPFDAERAIDRIMNDFDSREDKKERDQKQIDSYMDEFRSDIPHIKPIDRKP